MNYNVELGDIDIPDNVLQQLQELYENGGNLSDHDQMKYPEAFDWLNANIHDSDAYSWEYEINELSLKE